MRLNYIWVGVQLAVPTESIPFSTWLAQLSLRCLSTAAIFVVLLTVNILNSLPNQLSSLMHFIHLLVLAVAQMMMTMNNPPPVGHMYVHVHAPTSACNVHTVIHKYVHSKHIKRNYTGYETTISICTQKYECSMDTCIHSYTL
jgi:hypothetical protein